MTKSTGVKPRKKRTESEKAGTHGVKVSDSGAKALMALAKNLFAEYPQEHRDAGINRPSTRVAVDYLLIIARYHGEKAMEKVKLDRNLWIEIGRLPGTEE